MIKIGKTNDEYTFEREDEDELVSIIKTRKGNAEEVRFA